MEPFPELETEERNWVISSTDFQLRLNFLGDGPKWQSKYMHLLTDRSRHSFDLKNVDLNEFVNALQELIAFAKANNERSTDWENAE